jgi:hypothetical protein
MQASQIQRAVTNKHVLVHTSSVYSAQATKVPRPVK